MEFTIAPTTGLNLELRGSVGRFRVGDRPSSDNKSLEVLYLQTHLGFDPRNTSNAEMLKQLAPVREVFDYQSLDFDEIMQRDIDDARVSTELIPYLLDATTRNTIKFFPPIIAVVLPIATGEAKPGKFYPQVSTQTIQRATNDYSSKVVRSGTVGAEAFEFEYPLVEGEEFLHDKARLRLNTNRVRIVIIDGQHRAMALIALYRNLNDGWTHQRAMPFKDYYGEWTKEKVDRFDLSQLQLPVIVCTFPDLAEGFTGDYDVIRAARSTFLTLNKTARKVSNSRNILLDDCDLVSHFLRDTLGIIKQRDVHAESAMRIWNIELDQFRDRIKVESPVACTGVPHVYYTIEHLMFDEGDIVGASARSGKFFKRTDLAAGLLRRLNGRNILGAGLADTLQRHSYSADAAELLSKEFQKRYGVFLLRTFDEFGPFRAHNSATLAISTSLQAHQNSQIRSILYEGQNIGRTFQVYQQYMADKKKTAAGSQLPPALLAIINSLAATNTLVGDVQKELRSARTEQFIAGIGDKHKFKLEDGTVAPLLQRALDELYENTFTTGAFQAALVCGFFMVLELAEEAARGQDVTIDRAAAFSDYIDSLNKFFAPTTAAKLRSLLRVFLYDLPNELKHDSKGIPDNQRFGEVVFRGEMKPDEWPKFRYLLLELWSPTDTYIRAVQLAQRDICRAQVFKSLLRHNTERYCESHHKAEQDLLKSEMDSVWESTYEAFTGLQHNLLIPVAERLSKGQAKEFDAPSGAVSSSD